jgi:hypothetical protein
MSNRQAELWIRTGERIESSESKLGRSYIEDIVGRYRFI